MSITMKPVKVRALESRVFPTSLGNELILNSGVITGVLGLRNWVDPVRCSADMGFFEVIFEFRAANGDCFRHESVLPASSLWPSHGTIARGFVEPAADVDLRIRTLLDSRETYSLTMEGGEVLSGRFKYLDCDFRVGIQIDCLEVVLRFLHSGPDRDDAKKGQHRQIVQSAAFCGGKR